VKTELLYRYSGRHIYTVKQC